MAESELECFIRVKTAESSKGEIERKKKHKNVKLKENVPGAMLPREKPEECTMCYRSSNSNKRFEANVHILAGYVLPFVFYKMPDQASSHLTKFQSQRDVVISHIPHTYSKEMASKSQTVRISNASSPLLFLDCGSAARILITHNTASCAGYSPMGKLQIGGTWQESYTYLFRSIKWVPPPPTGKSQTGGTYQESYTYLFRPIKGVSPPPTGKSQIGGTYKESYTYLFRPPSPRVSHKLFFW